MGMGQLSQNVENVVDARLDSRPALGCDAGMAGWANRFVRHDGCRVVVISVGLHREPMHVVPASSTSVDSNLLVDGRRDTSHFSFLAGAVMQLFTVISKRLDSFCCVWSYRRGFECPIK